MAAQEISVKKYVVRLSREERERLETLIRKGKSPAQRLLKARILLKADVSEAGEGWSDSRIIKALETSVSSRSRSSRLSLTTYFFTEISFAAMITSLASSGDESESPNPFKLVEASD